MAMDPSFWSGLFKMGGQVMTEAVKEPPAPPQRADGYSMGGWLDSRSSNSLSSGSTGGAYGGAFSQSTVDGSNWTVSTGTSKAIGGGTSGGNGGLSPTLTSSQAGVAPQAPFSFGDTKLPTVGGSNQLVLAGVLMLAYLIVRR